jgi:hypothetical protein
MKRLLRLAVPIVATLGIATCVQAMPFSYIAALDGASESSPNVSPGAGDAWVELDLSAHLLRVMVNFVGLDGTTTAAHVHGPPATPGAGNAGVITMTPYFIGFPVGVTSGTYDNILDTTLAATFSAAFLNSFGGTVAAAEAALATSLADGTAYLNIHTTAFPGGEIRGFLEAAATPEPVTLGLLLTGTLILMGAHRRIRR